jgi:capsular polysaccharide biosynthesis protein
MVSQAIPPQLPSTPKREIIVLAALLGGLVIGVALAFLLEYRNRGVRGVEDVEDFIGVKVLATIPRVSGRRWQHAGLL